MEFTELVAERLPSLTPDMGRVACFLLEHPHRLGHLSAARIGEEVGVSDATVIRTVRSLGFDSLADMRERVASEMSPQRRLDATLRAPSRGGSLVERLVGERCDDVAQLVDRVRGDDLVAAVRVLARAKRLVVVGFGPSGFLAGYTAHHARRLGIVAHAVTATGSDLADELLDVRPSDGYVVLSYDPPGGPVDVVLAQAAAARATVVLVTDAPSRRSATVVLPVGRGDPRHVASHAATLAVLESLVLALAARHDQRADAATSRLRELRADIAAASRRS